MVNQGQLNIKGKPSLRDKVPLTFILAQRVQYSNHIVLRFLLNVLRLNWRFLVEHMPGKIIAYKREQGSRSILAASSRQALPIGQYIFQDKQEELGTEGIQQDKEDPDKSLEDFNSRVRNNPAKNIVTVPKLRLAELVPLKRNKRPEHLPVLPRQLNLINIMFLGAIASLLANPLAIRHEQPVLGLREEIQQLLEPQASLAHAQNGPLPQALAPILPVAEEPPAHPAPSPVTHRPLHRQFQLPAQAGAQADQSQEEDVLLL